MSDLQSIFHNLGLVVVAAPLLLLTVIGVASLVGKPLSERLIGQLVPAANLIGLFAALGMLGLMLATGVRQVPIELGSWVSIPRYHFAIKFEFDRLSVPFVILTFVLCGTIGKFADRYMHREPGFNRFFVFYALFLLGMIITSLSGTIETLFAGWELVGLSSALLVAYFHDRPAPVRNGLRVWIVYRVSDAALLVASVVMHHMTGQGDFDKLLGGEPWPLGHTLLTSHQALLVGLLLLMAAAGKSAMVPFSGWLPRAMEGPTPSSAIFYGALSVHLGAFLLLRISPILAVSPLLCVAVICVGLLTAVFATIAGKVQTDIKSALSFASMTQVGIIFVEIGLGLRYIALVHILGHACLRTLQFLRAPSLLYDYKNTEDAIGDRLTSAFEGPSKPVSSSARIWIYRWALERGYLDAWLSEYIARPLLALLNSCDKLERRWTDFLSGGPSRESEQVRPLSTPIDDMT